MQAEFKCAHTTPLHFVYLFSSTHLNKNISNRAKKLKRKVFEFTALIPETFRVQKVLNSVCVHTTFIENIAIYCAII